MAVYPLGLVEISVHLCRVKLFGIAASADRDSCKALVASIVQVFKMRF